MASFARSRSVQSLQMANCHMFSTDACDVLVMFDDAYPTSPDK